MALPHSRVLIHQPLGGAQGQATDIEIQAQEILRIKKTLNEIMASNTGQSIKKIEKDTDRDYIMTAQNAQKGNAVGPRTVPELTTDIANEATNWRYAVAAFFMQTQHTGWPATHRHLPAYWAAGYRCSRMCLCRSCGQLWRAGWSKSAS